MPTQLPIVLFKNESRTLNGQVIDPTNSDAPVNCVTAHGGVSLLQWEVRARPGSPAPALFHKDLAAGIVWVDQTVGTFQINYLPSDLTAIPSGNYWHDVVIQYVDGVRFYIFKPAVVQIRDVVNPGGGL